MSLGIPIPHLNYEQIRCKAEDFLAKYYPSGSIPVPIEDIVDLKMGINIYPIVGLKSAFEIDGFTSSDLREIAVDDHLYQKVPNRFRFTLAHELGHIILHADIYGQLKFNNAEQWKECYGKFSEFESKRMEWQANAFGGLVLVPKKALEQQTASHLQDVLKKANRRDISPAIWEVAENLLAKTFEVSGQVMAKRLDYDKIKEKLY